MSDQQNEFREEVLLVIKGNLEHNDPQTDKYKDVLRVVKYNDYSPVLEKANFWWSDKNNEYRRNKGNKSLNKEDFALILEKAEEIKKLLNEE